MRTIVEAARLADGVSGHAWATFLALHKAARTNGTVVESIRELASATGSGTRSVPRLLGELGQHGLIAYTLSGSEVTVEVL